MFYEVVIDAGETSNKCTIAPLSDRPDFRLYRAEGHGKGPKSLGPLKSSILLHHEGQCLTSLAKPIVDIHSYGIATVDCVWRRLDSMLQKIEGELPLKVRIPDEFKTAYPRRSIKDDDPKGGLATIEAIFVAAALLGNWDVSLLSRYYFGHLFVEQNRKLFSELGVIQASDPNAVPKYNQPVRNSRERKAARGRA